MRRYKFRRYWTERRTECEIKCSTIGNRSQKKFINEHRMETYALLRVKTQYRPTVRWDIELVRDMEQNINKTEKCTPHILK
jgi:hypothetical protein